MSEVTNTSTLREALERIALIAEGQVTQYARAREQVARIARDALAAAPEPERKMDDATRLRLLEDALRDRDWMRVMDVVEDMGGNWRGPWERTESHEEEPDP